MTRRYILRRLLQIAPVSAAIVAVGFLLIHLAPGDPVLALAGESGDAEYYRFMREKFGLDRPLPAQFARYVNNVARGDFGVSYIHGRPAMAVISERLPATLLLTGSALVLSTLFGIAMALVSASRPHGVRDAALSTLTLGLYAAPVFFLAQMGVLLLSLRLGWFPVQGMTTARSPSQGWAHVTDVLWHLVLPVSVLASQEVAAVARLGRTGLMDELGADHIRTARAKGLSEWRVLLKHALRRALLPVVTVIGGRIGHLVAGAVVVEVVFGWPGIGQLLLASMRARDIPVVLGIFTLVALGVVIANLLTDLIYVRLDPRIRYR
ncbi:MAG: ABC transporter permease [Acidimicrobiia bacterium]